MIMLADACAAVKLKPCVIAGYPHAALSWSAKATYLSGGGPSGGGLEAGRELSGGGLGAGGGLQEKAPSAGATIELCVRQGHLHEAHIQSVRAANLLGGGLSGTGLEAGGGLSGGGLGGGGGLQVKAPSAEAAWCCMSQRHMRQ